MNLDKCTGMEQSHQHQPDRKDTTQPQRFISFIGFYISLIAFILCGSLSSSHSFLFSQMTPAKKMVPTPGSSRIVSRVASSRFLSRIQNKSPLQHFFDAKSRQLITSFSQASAVATTLRSPRAGRVAKGTSPRVGGKPASKVFLQKLLINNSVIFG